MTFCNNNKIETMVRKLESRPFLFFFRDHLRSTLGITCGRGSFAVHFGDHLRSRDHLRSGITCGTVQNLHQEFLFYTQSEACSARFIPSPCFIPSPYFPVRVLYLVRILYPVRSPQSIFYTDRFPNIRNTRH